MNQHTNHHTSNYPSSPAPSVHAPSGPGVHHAHGYQPPTPSQGYPPQNPAYAARKKTKTPVALVVGAVVLAVGIMGGGLWLFFIRPFGEFEERVERIVVACSDGSTAELCTAQTGGPAHVGLPVPFPEGFESVDINSYCRKNNLASVGGALNFETKTLPFSAEFRRQDGEWKLLMLGPSSSTACDRL